MRILLKLSGEALAGPSKTGFDEPTVRMVAKQIAEIVSKGTQVGVVIGGGNFWRGRSSENIDRTKAMWLMDPDGNKMEFIEYNEYSMELIGRDLPEGVDFFGKFFKKPE